MIGSSDTNAHALRTSTGADVKPWVLIYTVTLQVSIQNTKFKKVSQ